MWIRLKGNDTNGAPFGGSPLTGGGATPLAPASKLSTVMANSPPSPETTTPIAGFTTNEKGDTNWTIDLNFLVVRGAYPFNVVDSVPTAIVNPYEPGGAAPFMPRIVSHCQDSLAHGLFPGAREAWFDWPE